MPAGKQRQRKQTFRTRKEAEEHGATGQTGDPGLLNLGDYIAHWIEETGKLADSTWSSYRQIIAAAVAWRLP